MTICIAYSFTDLLAFGLQLLIGIRNFMIGDSQLHRKGKGNDRETDQREEQRYLYKLERPCDHYSQVEPVRAY